MRGGVRSELSAWTDTAWSLATGQQLHRRDDGVVRRELSELSCLCI